MEQWVSHVTKYEESFIQVIVDGIFVSQRRAVWVFEPLFTNLIAGSLALLQACIRCNNTTG